MHRMICPEQLQSTLAVSPDIKNEIRGYRKAIIDILKGKDPRLLLIAGPCSIHHIESSLEYAKRLSALSHDVDDVFMVVMRTYFEKPRTTTGWKGFLYDPHLDSTYDMQTGIFLARTLLLKLAELKLPCATEFLEPLATGYIEDLISWGSIGARTAESPIHRQLAAALEMPVGFKNRTDGNIDIAIQACLAAQQEHLYLGINPQGNITTIHAKGNPHPHIVLRGGQVSTNYDIKTVQLTKTKLEQAALFPSLIIDCSHGNSKKNHLEQVNVFSKLIEESIHTNSPIRGIMLESFLLESADPEEMVPERSITDPCLDWDRTEQLIRQKAAMLREKVLQCTI